MLTIGQLAAYAGTTPRAVRHYHKIGLMPEPARSPSGYRSYDAGAVVRLIRIRTLVGAGVPLSRVQDLLEASPDEFTSSIQEIDRELDTKIQSLKHTRVQLAQLVAGERLTLPATVVEYLDRLRALGVDERYVELERDAWIMVAAQMPGEIEAIIARKHRELDDPDMLRLYRLLRDIPDWAVDDQRVVELADMLDRLWTRAVEDGVGGADELDDQLINLLDATMAETSPVTRRLLALLEERGWRGWTRIERVTGETDPSATGPE